MKASWTQGLDSDMQKEVRGDFLSSRVTRHRLIEMLTKRRKSLDTTRVHDDYDVANWPLKQADRIGEMRAIDHVISLLED